jgi:peptidoglycan-associated lipoprotein
MMGKQLTAILVTTILSGCSTEAILDSARSASAERQVAESIARQRADAAARQTRLLKEEEDLRRQLDERRRRETAAGSMPAQVNPLSQVGIDGSPLRDPTSPLQATADEDEAKNTIYYEYDAYTVKAEYQPLLESQARQLMARPDAELTVEGNCDERGSREYNLALGQRRADAVKRALMLLGVPATQVKTVSFGSEHPASAGHSETDLALNRRSDMVYAGRGSSK